MQDRCALAALMEVVERRLPQAKRNALLRDYKRSSVALRRRQKKGAAGAGWGEGGCKIAWVWGCRKTARLL